MVTSRGHYPSNDLQMTFTHTHTHTHTHARTQCCFFKVDVFYTTVLTHNGLLIGLLFIIVANWCNLMFPIRVTMMLTFSFYETLIWTRKRRADWNVDIEFSSHFGTFHHLSINRRQCLKVYMSRGSVTWLILINLFFLFNYNYNFQFLFYCETFITWLAYWQHHFKKNNNNNKKRKKIFIQK